MSRMVIRGAQYVIHLVLPAPVFQQAQQDLLAITVDIKQTDKRRPKYISMISIIMFIA
jgi:hypothetical protein